MAVILIILGVLVALVLGGFIVLGKTQVDVSVLQSSLRQCCMDRGIYDCSSPTDSVTCKTPYGSKTLTELKDMANVADLNKFCNCPL